MLKHVNAVALMPVRGGRRISLLGRRVFNILLHRAQGEGERDEYHARMHELLGDAGYNSNNTDPIKKILKELLTTTVEWQSPTDGEIETWDACNLLSGAGTSKDKRTGAVTVRWRFDSTVRAQLLSPDRYARLSLEAITQLSTHASMALYEICARYVDNPGHKTARQHWRWWRPVLTGVSNDDSKAEYRFFKRDVINKAVAEINARTPLEVKGPIEYKERDNKTIAEIQFEVRLKGRTQGLGNAQPKPFENLDEKSLPLIGRAINSGVKQSEAEELFRRYGPGFMTTSLGELEKRLQMPSEKVGAVNKPGAWLKANLVRASARESVVPAESPINKISSDEVKKHRAALTDEWLRRRKETLCQLFPENTEAVQQQLLDQFREELQASKLQVTILKRFEISGWNHRMVRETFTKFLGSRSFGPNWDKPTTEDILAMAVELSLTKKG